MASIAAVGNSSNSELIQMLQQLIRRQTEGTNNVASMPPPRPDESRRAEFESKFEEALIGAGLDPAKLDEVREEIKSAVSAALSESDGSTDPRQAVSQAVEATLQAYGVDTEKLKEQMESKMGSRPAGPPPGGPGAGGPNGFDSKLTDALTAAGADSSLLEEIKNAIDAAIESAKEDSDERDGPPDGIKAAVHDVLDQYGIDKDAFDQEMESGMGSVPPGPPPTGGGQVNADSQSHAGTLLQYLGSSTESSDLYSWLAGFPTISVNRAENIDRDIATCSASDATVQGAFGSACIKVSARPISGSDMAVSRFL